MTTLRRRIARILAALSLAACHDSGMPSKPPPATLDESEPNDTAAEAPWFGTLYPGSELAIAGHVTSDGSVAMHVKINRDEPDFNQTSPRGDPTILKREAETDLLVMDGHTAVIGGIFTRNTGRNLDQVPFFGDIPILGVLFQRRRASDTRNELVIFITPRIVNRAEALGR